MMRMMRPVYRVWTLGASLLTGENSDVDGNVYRKIIAAKIMLVTIVQLLYSLE